MIVTMTVFIVAIILIVLFLVYLFLLAPHTLPKGMDNALWQANYAHRGLHSKDKTMPENSMAAFRLAVESGYGIELDINLTVDNQIVVFHDDNLKRVCGVDKLIADCTYEELQQYRLCGTDEKIPLFSEVLKLVDGRTPLIVELKATKRNSELCRRTADMLNDYKGTYCIESFHPLLVRWFYKNRPEIVRGQLSAGYKEFGSLPFYQRLILSSLLTNVVTRPHFVAYRHQDANHKLRLSLFKLLGGKLAAWTVRDNDNIDYCRERFDVIIFEFFRP